MSNISKTEKFKEFHNPLNPLIRTVAPGTVSGVEGIGRFFQRKVVSRLLIFALLGLLAACTSTGNQNQDSFRGHSGNTSTSSKEIELSPLPIPGGQPLLTADECQKRWPDC
jgi:hypothetical protein